MIAIAVHNKINNFNLLVELVVTVKYMYVLSMYIIADLLFTLRFVCLINTLYQLNLAIDYSQFVSSYIYAVKC